jgi:hypothetical protein
MLMKIAGLAVSVLVFNTRMAIADLVFAGTLHWEETVKEMAPMAYSPSAVVYPPRACHLNLQQLVLSLGSTKCSTPLFIVRPSPTALFVQIVTTEPPENSTLVENSKSSTFKCPLSEFPSATFAVSILGSNPLPRTLPGSDV